MDFHHEGPLRERVEQEVFVVVQIDHSGGEVPVFVLAITHARIRDPIAGEFFDPPSRGE
jgi:hypothetical protein